MKSYIQKLEAAHRAMEVKLESLYEIDISQTSGKTVLFAVIDDMIQHIEEEDQELYQVLKEAAKIDPEINNTFKHFAHDVSELSQEVLAFFNKYRNNGISGSFREDFEVLHQKIKNRMRKEELVLFSMYEDVKKIKNA